MNRDKNRPKATCSYMDSHTNKMQQISWKGESLSSLHSKHTSLPPLEYITKHKVFFKFNKSEPVGSVPQPNPEVYQDNWSNSYVRMPCSPKNVYTTENNAHASKWELIQQTLRKPIKSSLELQNAILSYHIRRENSWNFKILHLLFSDDLIPDGGSKVFFENTLPKMCTLALDLPVHVTQPIPLLESGCDLSLTFSQLQIASLIANMFFCTYPRLSERKWEGSSALYPIVHFIDLFSETPQKGGKPIDGEIHRKREKLRCFLHYFYRVTQKAPTGTVTFTRRKLGSHAPDWANSERSFGQFRMHVNSTGVIEDAGPNTIQVDFADPYVGGLVLNRGCVQEEIHFLLQPELLASTLFCSRLEDDETVLIEGAEKYSTSKGYGNTFCWTGDFQEAEEGTETARDEWGRWKKTVVAMDATRYTRTNIDQFEPAQMLRELNKAYCAFCDELAPYRTLPSVVSTGNWGCGVFGGNVHLKALLQMIACCQANKSMAYFTFKDAELRDQLYDIYSFLHNNKITVGQLWRALLTYAEIKRNERGSLYGFLKRKLGKNIK